MDYTAIINAFRARVEAIDRTIAQLESINSRHGASLPQPKRRRRKSIGLEGREPRFGSPIRAV